MIWYWGTSGSWWAWLIGIVMTVLFWGLIAWAIAAIWSGIRRTRQDPGTGGDWSEPGPRPDSGSWPSYREADPEQILARRYASGEIDEDEYHRRLDILRSGRYATAGDRS